MMKKTTTKNFIATKKKNEMKAWVPVKEVKTMEWEKEEEKQQSLLMVEQQQEEKKNKKIYPSLPSNYVTLAQLQECWLKQQNEIKQQKQQEYEEEKNDEHRPLEERHAAVRATVNVTVSRSNPVDGNRDDLVINRRVICVDSEDRRKSVTGNEIGGGNEDLNSKVKESKTIMKKKKKKYNNNRWKKEKARKVESEENGTIAECSAAKEDEIVEKTMMKIQSKDANSKMDEVEQKFRVLSVNSGNGKQNWKIKKMNDSSFRQSQSMKNNRNVSHGHGYGHGYFKDQRSSEAHMIWVKKDNSVGGN